MAADFSSQGVVVLRCLGANYLRPQSVSEYVYCVCILCLYTLWSVYYVMLSRVVV